MQMVGDDCFVVAVNPKSDAAAQGGAYLAGFSKVAWRIQTPRATSSSAASGVENSGCRRSC
jgi:hypothetical protein